MSGVRWTWEKKDGATWVDVTGTPTSGTPPDFTGTYAAVQGEINAELRVGVEYIDTDNDNQTIAAVAFEQTVAPSASGVNAAPMFEGGDAQTRMIAENAAAGTAVGDPVTATDDHRTALTYMMAQTIPTPTDDAPASFEIDSRTGQIRVREGAELNYDAAADRTYTLMVSVRDPDGGTATTIGALAHSHGDGHGDRRGGGAEGNRLGHGDGNGKNDRGWHVHGDGRR